MAQSAFDCGALSCSICLELLKNPVTIPCGHSYCMDCVQSHWDQKKKKQLYCCPECRQSFSSRPTLVKNIMLTALVEQLKEAGPTEAPAEHLYAGPGDVSCDVCTGRRLKAVKTCLKCLASYCETHLKPHHEVIPLKKHELVDPSDNLQENICSEHNEVKRMFCRSDQRLICSICHVENHIGHDTVSAAVERNEKQAQLETHKKSLLKMIEDEEKDLKKLKPEAEKICKSAQEAVQHNRSRFNELIHVLKEKCSEVERQIQSQQETEVSRVQQLQGQLQQDTSEMKSAVSELDTLLTTPDHNHFLRHCTALDTAMTRKPLPRVQDSGQLCYFDQTNATVSTLTEKLQSTLSEGMKTITSTKVDVLLSPAEPTTREGFLQYAYNVTLIINNNRSHGTGYYGSNSSVSLSEDNRRATFVLNSYYGGNQEECQVKSKENLPIQCYWEVQCDCSNIHIVVESDNPKKSWPYIFKNPAEYEYYDSDDLNTNPQHPLSDTVGVYLDRRRGVLSFYSVSETMTLLHRVDTTFPKALRTGVVLPDYGSVYFPKLKKPK